MPPNLYYDPAKSILEWIQNYIDKNLADLPIATNINDKWKQWKLDVDICQKNRINIPLSDPCFTICVITVGLHDIRLRGISWGSDRDRNFPLSDPSLRQQIAEHIRFCLAVSSD